MPKSINKKTNGNVFKTIVRGVVQEELGKTEKRLEKNFDRNFETLTQNLMDKIDERFEKYKNETVNKLDRVINELKRGYEELTAHLGRHDRIEERVDNLEAIHPQSRHQ